MDQVTVLTRCPHCAARVPSEAEWCSLCLANLRPTAEPAAESRVAPTSVAPTSVASTHRAPVPARGRHRKGAPAPAWTPDSIPRSMSGSTELLESPVGSVVATHVATDVATDVAGLADRDQGASVMTPQQTEEVDRIAAAMLAELAVSERADLGPLANPDISRGRKAAVIAGGATGMAVILLVIFAILGTIL